MSSLRIPSSFLPFLLSLAFLFAGCGSSGPHPYTHYDTPPATGPTGALTFNFVRAQSALPAPGATADIRFDLYSGPNGTGELVMSVSQSFSPTITLSNVPATVKSTVLVFYNSSGIPLATATVETPVQPGQSTTVDFADVETTVPSLENLEASPTDISLAVGETEAISVTATFDNGDRVDLTGESQTGLTYSSAQPAVVSVSDTGRLTGVAPGSASVSVSLQVQEVTLTDSVSVSVTPADVSPSPSPSPEPTPDPSPEPTPEPTPDPSPSPTPPAGLARIEVSPANALLVVGQTLDLTVSGFRADNTPYPLTSADYTVVSSSASVSVGTDNVLTAQALGSAIITVRSATNTGISDTVQITVVEGSLSRFESFTLGSPANQHGWRQSNAAFDTEIVAVTRLEPEFSVFGTRALRISNAVTSSQFGNHLFTPNVTPVGETRASVTGAIPTVVAPTNNHFEFSFDFATTQTSHQDGLRLTLSPSNGSSGRMSFLRLEDRADGLAVVFDDYPTVNGTFVEHDVATGLSRLRPHHVRLAMTVVEGANNDIVKVYVNDVLVYTGTSWEEYYPQAVASGEPTHPHPPIVQSVIFRISGTAVSGHAGNGFLIDNVVLLSSNVTL